MKNIIDYIYESQITEMSLSLSDYSFKVENRINQICQLLYDDNINIDDYLQGEIG